MISLNQWKFIIIRSKKVTQKNWWVCKIQTLSRLFNTYKSVSLWSHDLMWYAWSLLLSKKKYTLVIRTWKGWNKLFDDTLSGNWPSQKRPPFCWATSTVTIPRTRNGSKSSFSPWSRNIFSSSTTLLKTAIQRIHLKTSAWCDWTWFLKNTRKNKVLMLS